MRFARLAFVAVILIILTGCATLTTTSLVDTTTTQVVNAAEIEKNKGISYSLPKRLHKVHLTVTSISKALEEINKNLEIAATLKTDANKKLAAAKEAREKAETAYETAKKVGGGKPDWKKNLDELEAAKATKAFEYALMIELANAATQTYEELFNEVAALSAHLEKTKKKLESAFARKIQADNDLAKAKTARENAETAYETAKKVGGGKPDWKKNLDELEAALKTKTAKLELMRRLADEANQKYTRLVNDFAALSANNAISIKIEPQDPVADEKNQLIAKPNHWMTRDDSWDLTTDAQGLLTSADNTSADRTGDIVLKIAQAIAAFVSGVPTFTLEKSVPIEPFPTPEEEKPACEGDFDEADMKEVEYLVDFSKRDDIWRVDNWLCHWGYKIEVSGYKDIYSRPTPTDRANYIIKDREFSKPLELDSSGVGGLVYRRELPYKVQVCKATEKGCILPIAVFNIQMPNISPYSVVEFNASFFTTTKNTVKFDKGFLISSHQERPSELLGLVSLPADFTKSYFTMLTEIISLKINYSTKEADYLNALGKQIDAEKALKQKQIGN